MTGKATRGRKQLHMQSDVTSKTYKDLKGGKLKTGTGGKRHCYKPVTSRQKTKGKQAYMSYYSE